MPKGTLPALILTLLLATPTLADRIERKDGRVFEGRIVEETRDTLTIETRAGDLMFRQRVNKSNVRSLQREVREGPGYCVIPIEGTIGLEVTAPAFKSAVIDAKKSGARIVILSIDSPGGSLQVRDQLLAVLREHKELTFVAHVKTALSAAATLALACPKIYMTDRATLGAAVAFRFLPDGSHAAVEAKYRSAFQANERAALTEAGRSELWVRAMSESDLEVAIVKDDHGRPRIVESGTQWEGETIIKRKGQILTLTAAEAEQWGLSTATVKTLDDVRQSLGHEKWHNAGDGPAALMAAQATRIRSRIQNAEDNKKELLRLNAEYTDGLRRMTTALLETERLQAQIKKETAPIVADTRNKYDRARRSGAGPARLAAIEAEGKKKFDAVVARYQSEIDANKRTLDAASKELDQLKSRRTEILTALTTE